MTAAPSTMCQVSQVAPTRGSSTGAPDLLRLESFGALYYDRKTCRFHAIPRQQASLLAAACEESILDVYARDPASYTLTDTQVVELVVQWQARGWLDETFRCPARIVSKVGKPQVLTGPLVTHLQMTHACNLRCTHCYVDILPRPAADESETERLISLFADLQALGSPVLIMAGGEPMLHPDFWTLLDALKTHELDAWLCTNATLIHAEQARRLAASPLRGYSISLDGPDAATHDAIRGPKRFAHAMRGIRHLVDAGAPDVQLRVTVTATNAANLLDFAPLATSLGVDKVVFKPFRQTGAATPQDFLFIERGDYLEAIQTAREAWPADACDVSFGDGIPARPPDWTKIIPAFGCVGGTVSATVTAKGEMVGCATVLDPDDWNLRQHRFREAWHHAPTIQSWRHFAGNDDCFRCQNFSRCGGGCRARALAVGRTIDQPDPWAFCSHKD